MARRSAISGALCWTDKNMVVPAVSADSVSITQARIDRSLVRSVLMPACRLASCEVVDTCMEPGLLGASASGRAFARGSA